MRRTALSTFLFVAILGLGCMGVSAPGKADPWTAANIGIQLLAPVLEAVVGTLSGKRSNEGTFKVQETAEHCEDPDSPRYDPSECEPDQIMKANTVDVGSWTTDYRVCFWAVTPDAPPRWKKYWPRFKAEALRRGLSPRDCKKIIFSTAEQTPSPTVFEFSVLLEYRIHLLRLRPPRPRTGQHQGGEESQKAAGYVVAGQHAMCLMRTGQQAIQTV